MAALDGIKRAQPPEDIEDHLFERLRFVPSWMKWFRFSAAALVLFGLINVLTLFSITSAEDTDYLDDNLLTTSTIPVYTMADNE